MHLSNNVMLSLRSVQNIVLRNTLFGDFLQQYGLVSEMLSESES